MIVTTAQANFSGGEVGTRSQGRIDSDRHATELATCVNWIVPLQGCVYRRPGTRFVALAGDQIAAPWLVPFEFSTTQAYLAEFFHAGIQFFKDGQRINAARTITGITKANPAVVTSANHAFLTGQTVTISGVAGMTQINGLSATVNVLTANTFQLVGVNSSGFSAYTSGGLASGVYQLDAPYIDVDLPLIQYAQSLDTLYVTHPLYKPRKLTRTAHDRWTLTVIDFQDGPFLDENETATTITPSATTGNISLTASSALFASTDVGRLVRIKHAAQSGCAKITAFASPTLVSATVQSGFGFGATTASSKWRLGVWSDTTGYPTSVTFFQDRLVFAGSTLYPLRFDMSKLGDYELFSPNEPAGGAVSDASAVSFSLNSNSVQDIRALAPDAKGLLLLTGTGEWIAKAGTASAIITATNIDVHQEGGDGCAHLMPVQIAKSTLFLQRAGLKVKEIQFYFDQDGFKPEDLTYIADHVTESGVKQMAYQREPDPIVWCVRNDGVLAGMTYSRTLDTLRVAWHRHVLGGVSNDGGAAAKVESACVIPTATGYELWLAVQRYVNGATVRHIERMTQPFKSSDYQHNAFFVDAGTSRTDILDVYAVLRRNPVSIYTAQAHGLANDDKVFVAELEGLTDLNSKIFTVQGVSATVTITIGSPAVVTWAGHGLVAGDPIRPSTTGALPTGLTAGTIYYVLNPTTDNFLVSATPGGAAIATSGTQSGVHTMTATSRIQLYEGTDSVDGTAMPSWKKNGRVAKLVDNATGLTHLAGQTVQLLADGGVQETTVSTDGTGTVTIDPKAGFLTAGLGYVSDLETLRFEAGAQSGVALGQVQRIDFLKLMVDRTSGIQIGRDFDNLGDAIFRDTGDAAGIAPPLHSGVLDVSENFQPDYTDDARVCIRQSSPLPATILAILPQIDTKERQ